MFQFSSHANVIEADFFPFIINRKKFVVGVLDREWYYFIISSDFYSTDNLNWLDVELQGEHWSKIWSYLFHKFE